jgi:osmotically inducible protein OsmC
MSEEHASARWEGTLKNGEGKMSVQSDAFNVPYSFQTRFGDRAGTNPEELLGAALTGCFSMALSAELEKAGYTPKSVDARASVRLQKEGDGFTIPAIRLDATASVPDISDEEFQRIAEQAKNGCPVGKALSNVCISLDATLAEK